MPVFPRVPALVDIPETHRAGTKRQPQRALFPIGVEDRLVLFRRNRAKPHLSAEIVRAVHAASGSSASPVPIIESRVTSPASFSSLQPSVPAGRCGTTR